MHLALIGTLSEVDRLTQAVRPLILGSVYDLPDGKQITLRGCQQRRIATTYPGFSREEYRVTRAFIGGHLERESAFAFRGAQLDLCGLAEWAEDLTGIQEYPVGSDGKELFHLAYTNPEPLVAQMPGAQVTLGAHPTFSHAARRCVVEEGVAFGIEPEESLSEDDLNARYVYPLQNFVTLALGHPAAVREFTVWPGKPSPELESHLLLKVVAPRVFGEERYDAEQSSDSPLFLLLHVKERFTEVIHQWLQVSQKFADTCNLFFGIQYVRKPYLDTKFLAVVQALELYQAHRKGRQKLQQEEHQRYDRVLGSLAEEDQDWLRRRLERLPHVPFSETLAALVKEHGAVLDPLYGGDRNGFVAAARSAYEYILYRRLAADGAPQSDKDLYWLMERLRILMKDCFLSELGFSEGERSQLFSSNALYDHVRRLGWPFRPQE